MTVDPRVLGVDAEDGPAFFGELQARLAGLVLALLATRFLESLLFGVEPADPLTFGAVAAFLAGVALLASWLPARRVTAIDPTVAMRGDG